MEVRWAVLGLWCAAAASAAEAVPATTSATTRTPSAAAPVLSSNDASPYAIASLDDVTEGGGDPGAAEPQGGRPAVPAPLGGGPAPTAPLPGRVRPAAAAPTSDEGTPTPARAQRIPSPGRPIPAGRVDAPWYRHGLVALGLVLAVIVVIAWLARRYVPSVRSAASGPLRILGRTYLSPKQSLVLVQVGRRVVLLGTSSDRVSVLSEITDPEEAFELLCRNAAGRRVSSEPQAPFDHLLRSEAVRYAEEAQEAADGSAPDRSEQIQETMGRLQSLLGRLRAAQQTMGTQTGSKPVGTA